VSSTIQPLTGATVNVVGDAIVIPVNSNTPVDELTVEILYPTATHSLPLLDNCILFVSPKIIKDFPSMVSLPNGSTVTAPPPLFLMTYKRPFLPTAVGNDTLNVPPVMSII